MRDNKRNVIVGLHMAVGEEKYCTYYIIIKIVVSTSASSFFSFSLYLNIFSASFSGGGLL